jgi:beta-glucosidase-like glycosyl hydrolase
VLIYPDADPPPLFTAYSASITGQDQSPVWLDKRDVMNYYLAPYRAAVKAGVKTFMEVGGYAGHQGSRCITIWPTACTLGQRPAYTH